MKTSQEQFVIDSAGNKTGVILPLPRYRRLLEDLHDLAVLAERRAEKPITAKQLKRWMPRML